MSDGGRMSGGGASDEPGFWPDAPPTRMEHHDGRVVRCFSDRPPDLDAMMRAAARTHGDREAVIDGDVRLTHARLDALASAFAARLKAAGVGAGERVALLAGNGWPFVVALLGIVRLGAIAVPLGTRMSSAEVAHVVGDCGASFAVVDDALAHLLPEELDRCPTSALSPDDAGEAEAARDEAEAARGEAEAVGSEGETAVILYTSGTTGRPKGAMLTHRNLVHSCLHYAHAFDLGPDDRVVMAVPASHVTGLVAIILAPLAAGGAVVIMPAFDADGFLALAARERMTATMLVPAMYNLCLLRSSFADHDLSAWRIGSFGGAPMPAATMERLGEALPGLALVQAYGSTETTSPATIMPQGRQAGAPLSVGAPVVCADIRIMDEDGREVEPGLSGEIWIAGPMVSPGYWNDPERTAEAFPAGYWRSGDVGRFDADGLLHVHDRIKDMINRGGYKVWSAELENVLGHHPDVVEAAVVARPDPVLGEKTHAFVHCFIGARDEGAFEATLRDHCRAALADYKVPDSFTFTPDPLPRNANGKLRKDVLRAQCESAAVEAGDIT